MSLWPVEPYVPLFDTKSTFAPKPVRQISQSNHYLSHISNKISLTNRPIKFLTPIMHFYSWWLDLTWTGFSLPFLGPLLVSLSTAQLQCVPPSKIYLDTPDPEPTGYGCWAFIPLVWFEGNPSCPCLVIYTLWLALSDLLWVVEQSNPPDHCFFIYILVIISINALYLSTFLHICYHVLWSTDARVVNTETFYRLDDHFYTRVDRGQFLINLGMIMGLLLIVLGTCVLIRENKLRRDFSGRIYVD